jgi:hypothetical protein
MLETLFVNKMNELTQLLVSEEVLGFLSVTLRTAISHTPFYTSLARTCYRGLQLGVLDRKHTTHTIITCEM